MSRLENAIADAGGPLEMDGTAFARTYVFPENFVGFEGHFPGNPILPGVVQLMAGAMTAAEATSYPGPLNWSATSISRAKFLKQVGPGNELRIKGSLKPGEDTTSATVTITMDDELAATFRVTLSKEAT